jgi:hypothetical protein
MLCDETFTKIALNCDLYHCNHGNIYEYIVCRVDKTIEKDIWSLCEKASAINKVYEAKLNVSNTNSSSPRGNYNF